MPEVFQDPCYYPAVAIVAIMRILRDGGLLLHYDLAIQWIQFIIKNIHQSMVQKLLPLLIPGFVAAIANFGVDRSKQSFCLGVSTYIVSYQRFHSGSAEKCVSMHIRFCIDMLFDSCTGAAAAATSDYFSGGPTHRAHSFHQGWTFRSEHSSTR